MKLYKRLGITDERDACECCGRTGLKSTVALDNLATGEIQYFGSSCAAKAEGWGQSAKDGRTLVSEVKAQAEETRRMFRGLVWSHWASKHKDQSVVWHWDTGKTYSLPGDEHNRRAREVRMGKNAYWSMLTNIADSESKAKLAAEMSLTVEKLELILGSK